MVCISVWFFIGLSRQVVEQESTSKTVIHIAHSKTNWSGSTYFFNFFSKCFLTIRLQCVSMFKTIFSCDQWIFACKFAFNLLFLVFVQFRRVNDLGHVISQVGICKLEFGNTVLVIERNGVSIIDGLLEVVDRDVITKYLLRPFFP